MNVTATQPAPASTAASTMTSGSATNITSDFNTFLKLLTTQMTNQDPLSPMKAEEFTSQLATFSGVEQQVRTNELLSRIAGQTNGSDFASMTQWIGKEVEAVMPLHFEGTPLTLSPPPAMVGDTHQLIVQDGSGNEVFRSTIDASGGAVSWDGRTHSGMAAPYGLYKFSVESFQGGQLAATEQIPVFARVTEVRAGPSGTMLSFGGGQQIAADQIQAVREPV